MKFKVQRLCEGELIFVLTADTPMENRILEHTPTIKCLGTRLKEPLHPNEYVFDAQVCCGQTRPKEPEKTPAEKQADYNQNALDPRLLTDTKADYTVTQADFTKFKNEVDKMFEELRKQNPSVIHIGGNGSGHGCSPTCKICSHAQAKV